MKKLICIAVIVLLILGLFACGKAQDTSNEPAGSADATAQDVAEDATVPEDEAKEETHVNALFGGAAFVFGCDDSTVRIPCTYSEFISGAGFETPDYAYAPDPDRNPVDDGKNFEEDGQLSLPGGSMHASFYLDIAQYDLDENGGHVYIKRDGNYTFKADTYGGGKVFMVFANYYSWDDPNEAVRFNFPCGVKLLMSSDEIHSIWGEPYISESKGDTFVEYYMDGLDILVVGYNNDVATSIELAYGQEMVDQVVDKKYGHE